MENTCGTLSNIGCHNRSKMFSHLKVKINTHIYSKKLLGGGCKTIFISSPT